MNAQEIRRGTTAILGLGKVGMAVGYLLRSAGYRIVAVASRSTASLNKGVVYTGGKPYTSFSDAAARAECILITTADDAIEFVCKQIASTGSIKPGNKVIHMSGAGGLNLLKAAHDAGANVASIHPLQSFADVEGAIQNIPGSTFGITTEDEIREWSVQFVRDLGGIPFFISDADKPLYHAAACIASNYLTTLIHMVQELFQSLGLTESDAMRAFWPLVKGTIRNIEAKGTAHALTGPIARGDVGTIKKHVDVLLNKQPELLSAYIVLGRLTADLAFEKGTLSSDDAKLIKQLLMGGMENEHTSQHE